MSCLTENIWMSPLVYIHTYTLGLYNSSIRITDYLLTPLILCALILYVSGGTYSLTSTPNEKYLRNFFMAGLFTLRFFTRNLLRGSRRRNIFRLFVNNTLSVQTYNICNMFWQLVNKIADCFNNIVFILAAKISSKKVCEEMEVNSTL